VADIPDEFEVERPGEAVGDLALGLSEVWATCLEAIGPNMRAAFGLDQLYINLNPARSAVKGHAGHSYARV